MKHLGQKRDMHIICDKYNIAPCDDLKWEMQQGNTAIATVFVVNKSQCCKCHIKFNTDELDQDP